jgi:hypothetical protein
VTWYTFVPQAAVDQAGEILREGSGQVYSPDDPLAETPLAIRDLNEITMTQIDIVPTGMTEAFQAELPMVYWRSGDAPPVPLLSYDGVLEKMAALVETGAALAAAAQNAADAAAIAAVPPNGSPGNVLTWDGIPKWLEPAAGGGSGLTSWAQVTALQGYPVDGFPALGHSHDPADIIGSTSVGRGVLTATDKAAGRQALGAAADTVVSWPGNGTTAGTTAAGDHIHNASNIKLTRPATLSTAATNVQVAIEELAAAVATGLGGGGTGTASYERTYASGAYPVRGAVPVGVKVWWFGPVPPLVNSTYMRSGDIYIKTTS